MPPTGRDIGTGASKRRGLRVVAQMGYQASDQCRSHSAHETCLKKGGREAMMLQGEQTSEMS